MRAIPIAVPSRCVACLSVCVSVTTVSCAKTAEPIELKFGTVTRMVPRHIVLKLGGDILKGGSTAPQNVSILDLEFLAIRPSTLHDGSVNEVILVSFCRAGRVLFRCKYMQNILGLHVTFQGHFAPNRKFSPE